VKLSFLRYALLMTHQKMSFLRDVPSLRQQVAQWHSEGLKVAVVPTMGALHDGHLNLVRRGFETADRVIATIFINPKQFAAHEDLGRYPRDEAGDLAKLTGARTSVVFAPSAEAVYPAGFATSIHMEGPAKVGLEDAFRPQFFDGVATVVTKLFTQTAADTALFGEKDYQQLKVVSHLARDLDLPIEIVGVPTTREVDGLAMSSRNAYLSAAERQVAAAIYRTLNEAAAMIRAGANPAQGEAHATTALSALGFKVDYVAARNAETLAKPTSAGEPLRLLAAAWLDKTRLIDNIAV
jgi:pantoate--beta-alanine ligase